MVGVKGVSGGDAQDGPTETFEHLVTFFIALPDFGQVMNPAINLDDEPRARDGEIDNHAVDGMLAADGEAVISQYPEGFPSFLFGGVGGLAEMSGAPNGGVVCQSSFSPLGRRGWG